MIRNIAKYNSTKFKRIVLKLNKSLKPFIYQIKAVCNVWTATELRMRWEVFEVMEERPSNRLLINRITVYS